jgi:ATP-dependent Clp protease ATP-binding subunit ClpC
MCPLIQSDLWLVQSSRAALCCDGLLSAPSYCSFDAIVQFNALSKEMIRRITAKELREISGREGFPRNNLRLELDDEVIEHLISAGFDQRYGARPLQRTIERLVVAPLARYLLAHPEAKGAGLFLSLDREKKTLTCNQSSGSLRK